jgi:hypothetical protein
MRLRSVVAAVLLGVVCALALAPQVAVITVMAVVAFVAISRLVRS